MKKSKVLVPAMALLLFSTAASITGTVAWFSSTRTFNSEAGNFAVKQLEGNLTCAVTPGAATSASGDNISFDENTYLGDASFNHDNKKLFTDVPDTVDTFREIGSWSITQGSTNPFYYGVIGTDKYFYAATWQYTFTYEFVAEQQNMNLFFDVNNASFEYYKADGSAHGDEALSTAQGFRLAFKSSTKAVVWAPFRAQDSGTPKAIRFVESTSTYGDYATTGVLLDSSAKDSSTYALGTAADSKATSMGNCIGHFAKPATPGSVNVTIEMTAWFEGTDASIITSASTKMQQVSARLPFVVRPAA